MNVYRIGPPPRRWDPKLTPWLVNLAGWIRQRQCRRTHRVAQVHVHDHAHVRQAIESGHGVMITPNHSSHADPYTIYQAVGMPLFIMATWHVFVAQHRLGQWLLQRHGCFSVDRDGTDMAAFKEAMRILKEESFPLVIFPEGEIYHCNDLTTPYLEGPATIAMTSAKRSERKLVIVPCAIKYKYIEDPTPELLQVMTELERQVLWRPKPDLPLQERIYEFSAAILALKEMEYLGQPSSGPLPERVRLLANAILRQHETTRDIDPGVKSIPERVKELRRRCVKELCDEESPLEADVAVLVRDQLDDSFLAGQLFSYPGSYVAESPVVERMAETIDKFEEDVQQRPTAGIRGAREAHIQFGAPIEVPKKRPKDFGPPELTRQIEAAVQSMLDGLSQRSAD